MEASVETCFRLSPARTAAGVSCGEDGVFVGEVPLLERAPGPSGAAQWRPRASPELDDELGKRFALPIESSRKASGLAAVARALDRGDIVLAQIATLHLQIPDPPARRARSQPREDIPRNPYPDRAECVEEWAKAIKWCKDLDRRGLLGNHPYRGMGKTFAQCLRGQVSEDCGGNSTSA